MTCVGFSNPSSQSQHVTGMGFRRLAERQVPVLASVCGRDMGAPGTLSFRRAAAATTASCPDQSIQRRCLQPSPRRSFAQQQQKTKVGLILGIIAPLSAQYIHTNASFNFIETSPSPNQKIPSFEDRQNRPQPHTMITDSELYRLAIFLGSAAMVLIILYHFLEVNADQDEHEATKEKAPATKTTTQSTPAPTKQG